MRASNFQGGTMRDKKLLLTGLALGLFSLALSGCKKGCCGDGDAQGELGETCDDGNNLDGDGCESDCQLPLGICGDGVLNAGEACDDGNTTPGDNCRADCLGLEVC